MTGLFRNFGLKLLAVALGIVIWFLVSGELVVERALRIPLEFANLPANLELVGDAPTAVDVRVRGSSGTLSRMGPGELIAVLDVRSARPGQRLFHVTGGDVRAPFGVEVVQISPSSVPITFEPSATKRVPVVAGLEGEPGDGFVIGQVVADPEAVDIVGPATAVERLTEAITEPISVDGAVGPVTDTVNIGVADPSVRLRTPAAAKVVVHVAAAPVEWAVADVPVEVRGGNEATEVLPQTVTVFVRGPREARSSGAKDFDASVDAGGLRAGLFQLQVQVTPPERVGIVRVEPPIVRVRIR
jgi:hypothetical protein